MKSAFNLSCVWEREREIYEREREVLLMRIYMFWVHLNVINATKLPSMLLNVNLKGMVNVN